MTTTPKTWELRSVAIPTEVTELLAPVVAAQRDPVGLLWSRPEGSPIRPPTTTHWFSKAVGRCIAASVPVDEDGTPGPATFPRVTAHQLRHTAASLMIASGAHVKTIQRQLGHKSAAMTLDNYGTCSTTTSTAWPIGWARGCGPRRTVPKMCPNGPTSGLSGHEKGPSPAAQVRSLSWSCRESNPGPPPRLQGFSVCSSLCLCSDLSVTRTSRDDDPSRCWMSRPSPRPRRTVSPLADAGTGTEGISRADRDASLRQRERTRADENRRLIGCSDAYGGLLPAPTRFP